MKQSPKAHYQQLRHLSCEQLWNEEVPAFDRAEGEMRVEKVGVIRAVGVVFSELGTTAQKEEARAWLGQLLHDPAEKVRRYAMAALPKIGADGREEGALLELLESASSEREQKFVGRALEKIGGEATLAAVAKTDRFGRTAQKAEANLLRHKQPGAIRMDRKLEPGAGLCLHLRCRSGLEELLEQEIQQSASPFRVLTRAPGLVALEPVRGFSLVELYTFRCFASATMLLGELLTAEAMNIEGVAAVITSAKTQKLLKTFTDGPIRYRLELVGKGHQRGAVRRIGDRVYALCPALLNDSREATWQINLEQTDRAWTVELSPRLKPDPRFDYRLGDVPAASHPPLAACMALLAGKMEGEIVWDPFCGSGLELIERARLGGVREVIGTDVSAVAIQTAEENTRSASIAGVRAHFACCDFRQQVSVPRLRLGGVSLMISNPPLGRRVPIPNLPSLIADLFVVAEKYLQPAGRLVFVNPLAVRPSATSALKLEYRQRIDLGGFYCHLEKYVKTPSR